MMRLDGKVAVVTGSSRGIGAGIAKGLAAEGADLLLNYHGSAGSADAVLAEIRRIGRRADVVRADVASAQDVRSLFDVARQLFGKVDILVNNAGISPKRPFEEWDEALFDRVVGTNLKGTYLCTQAALPLMTAGSCILNVSSVHAFISTHNFSVYAASKGGLEALTRNLAIELGPRGIRVNAIRPGFIVVEEDPFDDSHPDFQAVMERFPMRRVGCIDDVVPMAVHLCTDDARYVTGATLPIDGGMGIQVNTPYPLGYAKDGARRD